MPIRDCESWNDNITLPVPSYDVPSSLSIDLAARILTITLPLFENGRLPHVLSIDQVSPNTGGDFSLTVARVWKRNRLGRASLGSSKLGIGKLRIAANRKFLRLYRRNCFLMRILNCMFRFIILLDLFVAGRPRRRLHMGSQQRKTGRESINLRQRARCEEKQISSWKASWKPVRNHRSARIFSLLVADKMKRR